MKPILFNTEMVQAILENRKTITRRLIKPQPDSKHQSPLGYVVGGCKQDHEGYFGWGIDEYGGHIQYAKPPYNYGDTLYVRETWCNVMKPELEPEYAYFADAKYSEDYDPSEWKWSPSIHMPKEAARLFLRVTSIRVERLWDITEEQALKEGFYKGMKFSKFGSTAHTARQAFMWWWQRQYDNGLYSWASNPWVWVTEFEPIPEYKAILKEI